MKKTIITVFIILACLLLALLIWELFFAEDGILHAVYNAVVDGVNSVYMNFTGGDQGLLPHWDNDGSEMHTDNDQNGETDTFNIDNG